MTLDHTHDASRRSWVASANLAGADYPIQNLPFSVFRRSRTSEAYRGGIAIGDQILDLAALSDAGILDGAGARAAGSCADPALNALFALGRTAWSALRHAVFALLETDAAGREAAIACLVPQAEASYALPATIGDYTDFYTSYEHAGNVGRLFSSAANVVSSNFHWLPIAYHGRSSSLVVSGHPVRRPWGQYGFPGAERPAFGPSLWLDYEVELGFLVGTGNALGCAVPLAQAEDHLFGACLLNDWSARDIQGWEMAPLGPFLAKNFATTLSPWVVTMDALEPFRLAWTRAPGLPGPPPHLDTAGNRARGALDIKVEAWIETPDRHAAGHGPARLSQASFRSQHWTVAQMLAHHTSGGCNLLAGDLLGTGTISGPDEGQAGSMIELSRAGTQPVKLERAPDATEERGFLQDGDTVILKGFCEKPGFARIGWGECRGQILPAHPPGGPDS